MLSNILSHLGCQCSLTETFRIRHGYILSCEEELGIHSRSYSWEEKSWGLVQGQLPVLVDLRSSCHLDTWEGSQVQGHPIEPFPSTFHFWKFQVFIEVEGLEINLFFKYKFSLNLMFCAWLPLGVSSICPVFFYYTLCDYRWLHIEVWSTL